MVRQFKLSDENKSGETRSALIPSLGTIPELFEEVTGPRADALALSMGSHQLTYGEMNARANRLAHALISLGVAKGSIVGVCLERSPELYISLLAILKAGGAYLPLDRDYPDDRLKYMLEDTKAELVLVHSATASRLQGLAPSASLIDVEEAIQSSANGTNPGIESNPEDLAYVMYTSGSSGTPKGVLIPHRGVVRLVRETNYCDFGVGEVFLQLAPISFDASTFEIWGPLLNGARLAIMPPGILSLPNLGTILQTEKVTTLWLTAGLFHLMVDKHPDDLKSLRQLLAGGDVLSPSHVRRAIELLENGVVINGYGPTETTTFACCYRMSSVEHVGLMTPIGVAICKTSLHILDENFAPVTVGQPGELWIGGQGVGLGYLNDPELSRQRFQPNPFTKNSSDRLYRTGDIVRKRDDGLHEFLGRVDDQVKILGHRVEPREIESTLRRLDSVNDAIVVSLNDPRGEKRLVAYVVSDVSSDVLKMKLVEQLPTHMIPSMLINVDSIPLTNNGKVDRSALPTPHWQLPRTSPIQSHDNGLEHEIVRIWENALGVSVGPNDNFFDLGGDSLLLIEVHSELQKTLDRDVAIMDLFEFATTRSLGEHLMKANKPEATSSQVHDRANLQREAIARHRAVRSTPIHD